MCLLSRTRINSYNLVIYCYFRSLSKVLYFSKTCGAIVITVLWSSSKYGRLLSACTKQFVHLQALYLVQHYIYITRKKMVHKKLLLRLFKLFFTKLNGRGKPSLISHIHGIVIINLMVVNKESYLALVFITVFIASLVIYHSIITSYHAIRYLYINLL